MDLHIILSVVFLRFAYCSGQYAGEIDCNTEGKLSRCALAKECTVTCPASCSSERLGKIIRGTRIYAADSPVCRSALHDYRIAPNSPKTNVTFIRSGDDTRKYLGSIQQAISSINSVGSKGYFYFSSPYITEEDILDVSTLNYNYFYQGNGPYIQECRIGGNADIQDFQFYIPLTANRYGVPISAGSEEVSWSKPSLQPGGYWCNIAQSTYSDVMSLAMPADAYALPAEWTITASIQEKVVIQFVLSSKEVQFPKSITWKKDRSDLVFFPNMKQSQNDSGYFLEIENVDVGDAGIYGIGFDQESDSNVKRGIVRLIVRRCRQDSFGPSCDQQCPECLNGGVCHDVIGSCVCPPGYHGVFCEKRCPTGYFGLSCSQSCASSRNAIGNSCKGALICLPDPFGCSCAAGYKGLTCDEEVTTATVTTTAAITPTSRPPLPPQERMCQSMTTKGRNFTVIQSPSNACQFSCFELGRKIVIPILKADGEQCKHGICVKGICQEASEKSVCPGDFNGVRSSCKEYCYSVQYPGMSVLMNVKDGELCIEEDHHGMCINGRCVKAHK